LGEIAADNTACQSVVLYWGKTDIRDTALMEYGLILAHINYHIKRKWTHERALRLSRDLVALCQSLLEKNLEELILAQIFKGTVTVTTRTTENIIRNSGVKPWIEEESRE